MRTESDHADALRDAVARACRDRRGLRIVGSGSKSFLTGVPGGEEQVDRGRLLSVAEHRGIIDYHPEELVITARAGTPLREMERVLAQAGQYLPFDPPAFRGSGTIGGAVACGLAGPGRPWRGAVRDAVLGVELINGEGQRLRFGGQVMKNVAGYDVSRLQAGAYGTLGVLLSVSLKVLPLAPVECTRVFEVGAAEALAWCRGWARRPYPLSGACHLDGLLRIRLSGAGPAVEEAAASLGGEAERDQDFWSALRDHRLDFFTGGGLWRCIVPPASGAPLEACLVNWAGAERWWRPGPDDHPAETLSGQGGHGRPFSGTFGIRIGSHLGEAESRYALRLKRAFDPAGILNPDLTPTLEASHAD